MQRPWLLYVGLALGLVACGEGPERAPRLDGYCDAGALCGGGAAPGSQGGSSGTGGAGGADASAEGGAETVTTVTGFVSAYADAGLLSRIMAAGPLELSFPAPRGQRVAATWSGGGPFSVNGVVASSAAWVDVTEPGPAPRGYLPTVQAVSTLPEAQPVELVVARAVDVELALSFASRPLTRELTKAVLLVQLRDRFGPAEGARVLPHGGAAILYAQLGGWSDVVDVTDATGLALVPNVDASSGVTTLDYVVAGQPRTVELRVRAGGLTVVGLEAAP